MNAAATEVSKPLVLHARLVTGTGGGPDKTILTLPAYYARAGFDAKVLYLRPPGDPGFETIRRRAAELRAPLIELDDRGPLDVSLVFQALKICRRLRPAIWHGHDYKTNLLGLLLRPLVRMQLVNTTHGWVKHTSRTPLYYRIDRFCLPRYRHTYCVSSDLMEECRRIGVPEERLLLLENGVDTDRFSPKRSREVARPQFASQQDSPRLILGAMGRLSDEKAFDLLIDVVASLIQQGKAVDLWIAGDGDQRAALQDRIDRHQAGRHIRLLGFVEDTVAFYESLDAFILSSHREGLPNVVLEAMAMKLPVVATEIAGLPRLVADQESGLLVPPGDAERLRQAIERLLTEPASRHSWGEAGRARVKRQFSFDARVQRQIELYEQLLRGSTRP
jgi:glycosyltransferase involved in cell wall biosynthesis